MLSPPVLGRPVAIRVPKALRYKANAILDPPFDIASYACRPPDDRALPVLRHDRLLLPRPRQRPHLPLTSYSYRPADAGALSIDEDRRARIDALKASRYPPNQTQLP